MWTNIIIAVAVLLGLAAVFGALLGFAAERFKVEGNPLVDQIDALLPQTQCGQCGFPAADPMLKPSTTAKPSTSAHRAVKPPSTPWPTCWT